jgi:flagellin-like protein
MAEIDDFRGVSPVISVILMVAIVVILGAVISVFVLGLGEEVSDPGPTVTFEAEERNSDIVVFTHRAGDTLDAENIRVRGAASVNAPDNEIAAGNRITVVPDPNFDEIAITWTNEGSSTILKSVDVDITNLILNSNFEQGSRNDAEFWEQDKTFGTFEDSVERTTNKALVGEHSMRQVEFTSRYSRDFTSDPVDVSPGKEYEFGGFYYLEATNDEEEDYDYYVTITWLDRDGDVIYTDPPRNPGGSEFQAFNEWTETEIEGAPYSAPPNAEQAELEISSRDNGNEDTNVYWDDIFLEAAND